MQVTINKDGEELINVLVANLPKTVIDRLDAFLELRDGEGNRGRAEEMRRIMAEGVDRREGRDHQASAEAAQALRALRAVVEQSAGRLKGIAAELDEARRG